VRHAFGVLDIDAPQVAELAFSPRSWRRTLPTRRLTGGSSGCFDFGRSTRDSGTYRFKAQWGAKEVPLYWCYILRPGDKIPDLRPESPKYRLATALWRRLPVGIARLIGPRIIAKLS